MSYEMDELGDMQAAADNKIAEAAVRLLTNRGWEEEEAWKYVLKHEDPQKLVDTWNELVEQYGAENPYLRDGNYGM